MTWTINSACCALSVLAVSACAPVAGSGRARTLGRGRYALQASPELTVVTGKVAGGDIPLPSAQLTMGGQYGLTDQLDLGLRLWGFSVGKYLLESWGTSIDTKLQLKRASDAPGTREADIAVAPRVLYHQVTFGGTPEHMVGLSVPLLFGWRFGQANQLVLGARIDHQVWMSESQTPLGVTLGGGSLGFVWQLAQHWALMPELVLLYSPLSFNGESGAEDSRGLSVLSLGFGVSYTR